MHAYTGTPNKMAVIYSELHQNIQDLFNEAGIEIMSPHYAQLGDGNRTTIPEQYLTKDQRSSGLHLDGMTQMPASTHGEAPTNHDARS